jgi:hypothetical protein
MLALSLINAGIATKAVGIAMPDDAIKSVIRNQSEKVFVAHERFCALADAFVESNRAKMSIDDERPSTPVVLALYAKAWKTAQAVYILATEGYGEDATILARSLTNLSIDLSYICHEDPEGRARQWLAHGWWERIRMAHDLEIHQLDTEQNEYNTEAGQALAKEWNNVTIRQRAERSGQLHFYRTAYRHGSAFEHSDSWSVQSFVEVQDDHVLLHLGPSTSDIYNALSMSLFALYRVIATLGDFYQFDVGTFNEDVQRLLDEGFGMGLANQ